MQEARPTTLVVFGITGDLSHRFLLPALAEIKKAGHMPKDIRILGVSRRQIDEKEALAKSAEALGAMTEVLTMDVEDDGDYHKLKDKLRGEGGGGQAIFYLAVPPKGVLPIIERLDKAGLSAQNNKLLLEKPFGSDLESARKLIAETHNHFGEEQVYRIDHYLAKEAAQNIAVFLGSNVLFRDVWNRQFIEYIEIVAAEKIGIEGRVNFYEQTGALRDIIQSHALQLAALTLMEPCPHDFDFADLPKRRLAALKNLRIPKDKLAESVVRGQYEGYTKEVDNPKSKIETFVALQLSSDDPRWRGVPIYIATGKNLDQKLTQIRVNFKRDSDAEANRLVLRIQPREGIEIDLWIKEPGYERKLRRIAHSFDYDYHFGHLPDAYEQVIVDAIRGSHSLFASSREVLESWRILQPLLDYWSKGSDDLKLYSPGSSIEQILQNS